VSKRISLIVADAGPLITLAVADSLNVLLRQNQRVIIPDMVKFEVTRDISKPGSLKIHEWIRAHEPEDVFVATTEIFESFSTLLKLRPGTVRLKGLTGENAASEVLAREISKNMDAGILLFEDGDVRVDNFLFRMPDNVLIMSTSEYLYGMEKAHLIESAIDIIARAIPIRGHEIQNRFLIASKGAEEFVENYSDQFKPRLP
jgi:hypothetical protein